MRDHDQIQTRIFGVYAGGFVALLLANKGFESSCWFFSDAKGEYSFSEMLTNVLYLVASLYLFRLAYLKKSFVVLGAGCLCFLLLLEESNYGQVFWGESETNFQDNEDQAALHTQLLRPISVVRSFDAAEAVSLCMLGMFTVLIPLFFSCWLKIRLAFHLLWAPLMLAGVFHVGKWAGVLIPWSCGYDSGEEVIETLMAATALYWALLYWVSSGESGGGTGGETGSHRVTGSPLPNL